MITSTLLPWLLVVRLQSPLHPEEEAQWYKRYSSPTAEQCEAFAKSIWVKYNLRYQGTMATQTQIFTTTCSAETKRREYRWFIKCDQLNNCTTTKYEGDKH